MNIGIIPVSHCCCGLFSLLGPAVPLQSVSVAARVLDTCAEVQVSQTYRNVENLPIQAKYIFPLDSAAAVCSFEAEVDGKTLVGVSKEKQQAQAEYSAAVSQGKNAYLLKQHKEDIFEVDVGNLPVGSTAVITLTYVAVLRTEGDSLQVVLPTSIAPRYRSNLTVDSSAPEPVHTPAALNYSISINIEVLLHGAVKGIASPSHQIHAQISGSDATVHFAQGMEPLDKDIVVNITPQVPHEPRVIVEEMTHENGAKSYAGMLTLCPQFELTQVRNSEVVFLVDRSGSMGGQKIRQVETALKIFLRSLPVGSYFNIVWFGSRYDSVFAHSRPYDADSMRQATKACDLLSANFGGTEIYGPLQWIFNKPLSQGCSERAVLLLTDGQVSNTDAVCNLVSQQGGNTRVFCLGVGDGVSHALVDGVARAGRGTALFTLTDEDVQAKVMQLTREALQPCLKNVRIDWGQPSSKTISAADTPSQPQSNNPLFGLFDASHAGNSMFQSTAPSKRSFVTKVGSLIGHRSSSLPTSSLHPQDQRKNAHVIQAPFSAPPVYDSRPFTAFAFFRESWTVPSKVTVTAESPDGPLTLEVAVDGMGAAGAVQGKLVHVLAARALIQDLDHGTSYLHKLGPVNADTQKNEIVKLGTLFGLASKHTAFVVVDHSHQQYVTNSVIRNVPSSNPDNRKMKFGLPGRKPMNRLIDNSIHVIAHDAGGGGGPKFRSMPRSAQSNDVFCAATPPTGASQNLSDVKSASFDFFGSSTPQSNFGSAPPPPPSSGFFGAPAAPSAPLFGSAPAPAPAPAPMTQNAAPASNGFSFGFGGAASAGPPPPPGHPSGGFGAPPPPPPGHPGGGFGAPPPPATGMGGMGGLGAPPPPSTGMGGFGTPPPSMGMAGFGTPLPPPSAPQPAACDDLLAEAFAPQMKSKSSSSAAANRRFDFETLRSANESDESDDDFEAVALPPPESNSFAPAQDLAPDSAPALPVPANVNFMDILMMQEFDGSFTLSDKLAGMVGKTVVEILASMPPEIQSLTQKSTLVGTLLAVLILESRCKADRGSWEMAMQKSLQWCRTLVSNDSCDAVTQALHALL